MTYQVDLQRFERSRAKLLAAIGEPENLTFVRTPGNVGDLLIHAGTRQLLSSFQYREVDLAGARKCEGDVALLGGCGAWCGPFQVLPGHLRSLEERFERVIVLPSSFDTKVDRVRQILSETRAKVFAREEVSLGMIRDLCDADIAHDSAFYFDYSAYVRPGEGLLTAFRTDQESAHSAVPKGNRDISVMCGNLEDFLTIISECERVRTDRAHVTIGAAMMGKTVEYLSSNYHKVPAIVDYSLRGFPVTRLPDDWLADLDPANSEVTDAEHLRRMISAINELVPAGQTFVLVDTDQLGLFPLEGQRRLPFLERDGVFWGPPGDDSQAIEEIERMRRSGAKFVVFAWLAFWWFDQYPGFHQHLRANYRCLRANQSIVVFDLQQQG